MKPQHAHAAAPRTSTRRPLIRYIDRFLMFYIRTADRLERTATWFNKLEGGIDYLRQVVDRRRARHLRRARGRHAARTSTPTSASGRRRVERPERAAPLPPLRQQRRAPTPASCSCASATSTGRPTWAEKRHLVGAAAAGRGVTEPPGCSDAGSSSAPSTTSPPTAACARCVGGQQVAIFRVGAGDEVLRAVATSTRSARRSCCRAGSSATAGGVPKVASPIYKQSFDLRTGAVPRRPSGDGPALRRPGAGRRPVRGAGARQLTPMSTSSTMSQSQLRWPTRSPRSPPPAVRAVAAGAPAAGPADADRGRALLARHDASTCPRRPGTTAT